MRMRVILDIEYTSNTEDAPYLEDGDSEHDDPAQGFQR